MVATYNLGSVYMLRIGRRREEEGGGDGGHT